MTRTSIVLGAILGMLLIVTAHLHDHAGESSLVDYVLGGVVLAAASWSSRGNPVSRGNLTSRIVLAAVACVTLVRFLPIYFQTYRMWPGLPIVIASTLAMGFGVLSLLLDKYRPEAQ